MLRDDPRPHPTTVLIVDDDADLREALSLVLSMEGFRCQQAADGIDALDYLLSRPAPDVVLLDLMMPRASGEDVLREMRRDASLVRIPVVVLSGRVDLPRDPRPPTIAWIAKPVDPADLAHIIRRHADHPF